MKDHRGYRFPCTSASTACKPAITHSEDEQEKVISAAHLHMQWSEGLQSFFLLYPCRTSIETMPTRSKLSIVLSKSILSFVNPEPN